MAVIKQMGWIQDSVCKDLIRDYDDFIFKFKKEIKHLEDWAKKQPHLPNLHHDQLALFFAVSYHSLEQTKDIIDKYFTTKTRYREFFDGRIENLIKVEKTLNLVEAWLPKTQMDGYRLGLVRLIDTDASKIDFLHDMRVFTAVFDWELMRNPFHKGLIAILDAKGFHVGYVPKINLSVVNIVFKYIQYGEGKINQVHIINCMPVVSQVITLIRPFLSPYLAKTLHVHTSAQMEEFHEKFVPKKYMPSNYGGELPSTSELNNEFQNRFLNTKDWFKDFDSEEYYIDESRRSKSSRTGNEMIGSFRQLSID